jgi:hypothetical protein
MRTTQPLERTDLGLVASTSIGRREELWDTRDDPGQRDLEEFLDEDWFARSYREDRSALERELSDPKANVRSDDSGVREIL